MITARRLPWALAAIGAFDGWTIPDLGGLGEGWTDRHVARLVTAGAFAAALFVAGWIHAARPRYEHGWLGAATVRILIACVAFGLAPTAIVLPMSPGFPSALRMAGDVLPVLASITLSVLPPALLLVHAAAPRSAPRRRSLLADADRAEDALALLAAVVLLPWWRSSRPAQTAMVLLLLALPAVAIGLHSLALLRITRLFGAVLGGAPTARPEGAVLSWDLGLGAGHRAVALAPPPSYRSPGATGSAVVEGDPDQALRSARRVLAWSAATAALAAAHGTVLLGTA